MISRRDSFASARLYGILSFACLASVLANLALVLSAYVKSSRSPITTFAIVEAFTFYRRR
jgi:hypothetical protein